MPADIASDHGDLALLAQTHAAELRPLLLRVHAQNFVDAPHRGPAMVASFEAIALGLIPLVPDDVLSDVSRLLLQVADVPPQVLVALAERLCPEAECDAEVTEAGDGADIPADSPLGLARDHDVVLDDEAVAFLAAQAIGDPPLAEAVLARPEATIFDRAMLYRHATSAMRAGIRHELGTALAGFHLARPVGEGAVARDILAAARRGQDDLLLALAGHSSAARGMELDETAGQELFVFTLVALGLEPSECIAVLLMLGRSVSRSVPAVAHLAHLARTIPRPVAAYLAGHEPMMRSARPDARIAAVRAVGALRNAAGRKAQGVTPARGPGQSVRADRRS